MALRCPACHGKDLRPTLARMLQRCRLCAWEGFPVPAPALKRIPARAPEKLSVQHLRPPRARKS